MSETLSLDELRQLAVEVARENGEIQVDLPSLKEAVSARDLLDALYDMGRRAGSEDALTE